MDVYGLADPSTGELRYVGKTERILRVRLNHHIHRARCQKTNDHKKQWILSVLKAGITPEIFSLESHDNAASLAEAEQFWIAYYKAVGCRLVNGTDGGEGCSGYRHTDDAKKKMSLAKKGKRHSEESLKKRRKLSPIQEQQLVQLYLDGYGTRECSEHFPVSVVGVWKILKRMEVPMRNSAQGSWLSRNRKR